MVINISEGERSSDLSAEWSILTGTRVYWVSTVVQSFSQNAWALWRLLSQMMDAAPAVKIKSLGQANGTAFGSVEQPWQPAGQSLGLIGLQRRVTSRVTDKRSRAGMGRFVSLTFTKSIICYHLFSVWTRHSERWLKAAPERSKTNKRACRRLCSVPAKSFHLEISSPLKQSGVDFSAAQAKV